MTEQPKFKQGANQLTNTLKHMIRGVSGQPLALDFGIINSDYSLTTNLFRQPIPKNEYNVCRQLLYDPSEYLTYTPVSGPHSHPGAGEPGTHLHPVLLPKKMRWLRPGDKVLVAWVQNEACIIDIIYSGSWVGDCEPAWT